MPFPTSDSHEPKFQKYKEAASQICQSYILIYSEIALKQIRIESSSKNVESASLEMEEFTFLEGVDSETE